MPDTIKPRSSLTCDYCCSLPAIWKYPATNFNVDDKRLPVLQTSYGGWCSCSHCHDLIEAGDMIALAVRSTSALLQAHPELDPDAQSIYADISALHQEFFAHRTGPAIPIGPDEEPEEQNTIVFAPPDDIQLMGMLAEAGLTMTEAVAYLRTYRQAAN